jgi:hypothetical protein
MPNPRQKMLAREIKNTVENNIPTTGGKIVEKCGYGIGYIKAPKRAIETKGVKKELQILGFSETEADTTVGRILLKGKRDENKLKAADMIYKRMGSYAPEKKANLNVNLEIKTSEESQKLVEEYEEKLKSMITKKNGNEES